MKRLLLLSCAIFALACPLFSQDSDGHALVSLWKEYQKADDDDLPRNQLDILTRIKDQARTKRLVWDFYDASQKYVAVSSSLDWKQSSRVKSEMDKEVSSFGSALMSFYHRRQNSVGNLLEFVQKNAAELKTTSNPQFYKKDSSFSSPVYSAVLTAEVSNDYEYALWSLFLREPEKVSSLMAECFEGRYPLQALMEYHRIKERYYSKSSARRKALQTFKEEYGSRAVSLLARQELLLLDFYDLRQTKTSTPAQFQSLRADCIQFNKDKKTFTSGSEKLIADVCTRVDDIITSLDSKEIDSKIDKGRVCLVLRNVPSVKLSVKRDGKTCHEATLSNLAGSYYVRDTIYYDLPILDDGEYEVNFSGGGEKDKSFYVKNTISAALKRDADSWGIYAADYQSGKPLEKLSLMLKNSSGKVSVVCPDVPLDKNGFTSIPAEIATAIPASYSGCSIVAFFTGKNGRYRCSSPVYLPQSRTPYTVSRNELKAVLLLDRAACNPGDTINFKVVVYEGKGEAMSCKQGVRLEAILYDTEGNKLESSELVTGEYGSAAGSLCARRTARNGSYVLRIYDGIKERLAQKNIRVDDFVLPTYDLFWDKQEHDYMPGDSICFSGRVVAYSGHSLSSVKAKYNFRGPGTNISDTFTLDPDGGFSLIFPTSLQRTYSSYTLELRITDGTGETLEFSNSIRVSSSLTLNVELENALRTDCRIPVLEEEPSHNAAYDKVVADNVLKLKYSLPNYPDFELSSVLLRGKEVLMNLQCDSEGKCNVDISSLASGIYYLSTTLTIKSEKGLKLSRNVLLRILRVRPGDKALYSDVPDFYASASSEGEIAAFIASVRGPLWVVAELYDANNHRLESRIVSLAGKIGQAGSLMKISFPFKKEYTDNVKLYLHSFKDGSYRTWTCSASRPEPPVAVFPLSVEGLREGMLPATAYTFRIKTAPASECAVSISDKALETVASNRWSTVPRLRSKLTPSVIWSYGCGIDASSYPRRLEYESEGMVLMKAAAAPVGNAVEEMDSAAEPGATSDSGQDDVHVREDFSPAICWQPQLMSDADGTVEVKFSTGDKLSTFVVQIFSHDKTMQTAVLRSEVVVSLPVKVAVVQPRYLYEGDSYVVRMTLSNSLEQKVDGNVSISGPQGVKTSAISVPASGSVNFDCVFDRVEGENLPLLAKFVSSNAEQGSDAVKFTIPVKKAEQEIRESHSAVLLDGMSQDAVRDSLMAAMVNVPAEKITEQKVISIIDMVKEALPDKFIPGSENVICQSESLYALTLAQSIDSSAVDGSNRDAMIKAIRDCANSDGGFGWFPGMSSSPIVTSVLLQRFAGLRRRGIAVDELEELWP
ncbi:MAG: hypothetical protein IJU69_04905, partial [Bacteroidales bacterium]|nr:hypothetical protein [Bacteroidales bacterium]